MNSKRSLLSATAAMAILSLLAAGCSGPTSDQEKRNRIDTLYGQAREKSFPNIPHVTVEKLLSELKTKKLVIVDVRSPQERRVSMIPGAISAEDFERDSKAYKPFRIVSYCTIGGRSGVYTKRLREAGFNAVNLKGSILAWAHAGQELIDENGPTLRVHVYEKKWSLLPRGYEPVW